MTLTLVLLISVLTHLVLVLLAFVFLPGDDGSEELSIPPPAQFTIDLSEEPPEVRDPLRQIRLPEPDEESIPEEATVEDRFSEAVDEEMVLPAEPTEIPRRPSPIAEPVRPPTPALSPAPSPEEPAEDEMRQVASPAPNEPVEARESPEGTLPELIESEPVEGEPEQGKDARALFPSWQDGVAASSAARAKQERFDDIDEGDQNLLNRRRTRYWSFFDRLVEQIRPHWHPRDVMLRHDPQGNVFGVRDRVTVLHITLTSQGALYQLRILRSSGVDVLDAEALKAVRQAAPFPNPPPGLQDEDGMIRFSFGFHLEVRHGQYRGPNIRWR